MGTSTRRARRGGFAGLVAGAPLAAVVIAALTLAVAPAVASTTSAASGFELTRGTQRSLHRLQESWLQWVGAIYRDNPTRAEEALQSIEANARQVGMTRLVDLSVGAVALALQASRDGHEERVDWALAAAERLDPGRPEVAFARATIERRQGAHVAALGATASGFRRLLGARERLILFADVAFWLITVALVAAALFVLVQVATKGSAVVADLRRTLARKLSSATVWLVTALVLLWPLVLPGGPLWLLLYWSALLWGYGSRSERAVTVAVWIVAALGPWLAAQALDRVALALSPPMRAVTHFAEGRLYGGLFADLDVLRAAIGDLPAGQEILADVHRTLGQWEEARLLYRQVQETEPENATALINLGAYQFRKSDFALANDYFRRATAIAPPSAGAFYNLSLSFSETYQFDESRQALAEARRIDGERVDEWVKSPHPDRVLAFNGGLRRIDEIERALVAEWDGQPVGGERSRSASLLPNLIAVAAVAALALGLVLYRRGRGYAEPAAWLGWRAGAISRWLRAFFPALSQAELGEGGKAIGSLAGLSAAVLAPRLVSSGIEVPILGGVPTGPAWFLGLIGLAVYVVLCVRAELGEGR
jgi:tetratricopeptide (TPR) repeat protein